MSVKVAEILQDVHDLKILNNENEPRVRNHPRLILIRRTIISRKLQRTIRLLANQEGQR